MDKLEIQATLETKHRTKTNKTKNITQKTEVLIKNGQTRDTGKIGYKTQNEGKQSKKYTTEDYKKMSNTDSTDKLGVNQNASGG